MKFFSKKNDDGFFSLSEENTEQKPQSDKPVNNHGVSHSALTPDEVISGFTGESSLVSESGALDKLKERIISAAKTPDGNSQSGAEAPDAHVNHAQNVGASTASEIAGDTISRAANTDEKPQISEKPKSPEKPQSAKPQADKNPVSPGNTKISKTLLDKCLPFFTDENGNEADINAKPLYKLQSVSEILKSYSEETLEKLSQKYDISFDDLGNSKKVKKPDAGASKPAEKPQNNKIVKPEPPAKPEPATDGEAFQKEVFEEKIHFKNIQSNVRSIISDIDVPADADTKPENTGASENTATVTFTPINDLKGGKSNLKVSSQTRPIDLTGELVKISDPEPEQNDEIQLEKNEFEEYTPKEEFENIADAGKFIRKFSVKKRNTFLIAIFTILFTLVLFLVKLPFVGEFTLAHTRTVMLVCAAVTLINVLLNCNMFAAFKKMFTRRAVPDVCAALATTAVAAYAVFGIIKGAVITDILLLLSIILSFRSLCEFYKASYTLSNFKQICKNDKKTAVRLIDDTAVTFAMAKNSIEGDILIAAPQKTEHIDNFVKYSSFNIFFGGRLRIVTIISVIISVIMGFACASYFDGALYGLYAAAAIQCFTALPAAFFIDTLPLYSAAKRINKKGGMIAGKIAAEYIEMANAVAINSADLFPAGTITLHQMQVLSENNLEDTIVRAASLTESLNSPLTSIFKKIAGTGNITVFPNSDTVKYEDRMGISGWVDNRLLFIGNRTLMEAHGIEVPSIEVDRKILRSGFFPVYVATGDKACALLTVQYSVDREIARELRKLTASGVTLLINSCDPNLIEEMICDYFGLYEDSVKVMSAAGGHMYKNAVSPLKSVPAPAAFKSNPLALITIMNCAAKIKKSNIMLIIIYILSLVLGTIIFAYTSLGGADELLSQTALLLYGIISAVISYIIYLFTRP